MDSHAAQQLEVRSRRGLSDADHPDDCPKLTLHGAAFSIPPRRSRVVPAFTPDGLVVETRDGTDPPESCRLVELAEIREQASCPTCGRPQRIHLTVRVDDNAEFLRIAFVLAGKLLDRQYDLTADQKTALLAFDSDRLPTWISQLLAWCSQ